MSDQSEEVYWGILNADLNRLLTSASGTGIWKQQHRAHATMQGEFGGGTHLEIVKIVRGVAEET